MDYIKNINGKTNVYSVIGCPVSHSFSPLIHNTLAELLGDNIVYVPFEVKPDGLKKAIEGAWELGVKGLNITIPHKQEVIKYLCAIDIFAEQIEAVNTLKYTKEGYKGYNTDVYGLSECLKNRGVVLENKNVVLLGAGGAAKSAAIMSASQNVKKLYIINRTINNADNIALNIKRHYNINIDVLSYDEINKINDIDVCIQTTPVGMTPNIQETPIQNKDFFSKIKIAIDIIFNPWQTLFLREAELSGCKIINGFDMLFFQAVKSYEIWHNIQIPKDIQAKTKNILELCYMQQL